MLLLAASDGAPRPAMADRLVDSIGINIHAWPGSPYLVGTTWEDVVLPALRSLGLRHLRDGLGRDAGVLARLRALARSGHRLTLICAPEYIPAAELPRACRAVGPRGIAMLEGVNEPDGAWAQGRTPRDAVDYQRDVHAAGRALGVPVAASAVIGPDAAPRYAGQAEWSDFGNCHPYPGGRNPETEGWGAGGYGSIGYARRHLAEAVAGAGKPVVATETGYHNAVTGRALAAPHRGCGEAAAAAYGPRLILHLFRSGIVRGFHYELLDESPDREDPESNFGWLRYDGTRKPVFAAIRNLIAELADPGPDFETTPLALGISGETGGVNSCSFQKRSGTWIVALWVAEPLWEVDRQAALPGTERAVRITFGQEVGRVTLTGLLGPRRTPVRVRGRTAELLLNGQVSLLQVEPA